MMKNQKGFSGIEAFLVLIIIAIVGLLGWFVWHRHEQKPTTKSQNTSGVFTGVVTLDECAHPTGPARGDVGCSLVIDRTKTINIVHGNAYISTWGNLYGFTASQDITGKRVEVKAHRSGSYYAISASDDYVKLLN